ncbi:hypothetical protein EDB86DRAFT_2951541 [Lactarius hatsudake]|nr:hypothetical protein EDB86DRAFT_2951541 [Lactarius hatsudake]
MTNAHERSTASPPISSFDHIAPSRKAHTSTHQTSPSASRRPPHINGTSSDHPPHPAPRPRSSSHLPRPRRRTSRLASILFPGFIAIAQRLTCPPSSRHHLAPYPKRSHALAPGHRALATCRTPAPAVTPTSAATTSTALAGGATGGVPAQMAAAARWGDVAIGSERRRTSPVRKRKASEMLGTESEAKKKYKKKMNNKDAMTQLRDALPEHMRPPERQAKSISIKYIRELTAENERLRAENVKQARELADRPSHDPERSGSGEAEVPVEDE